MKHFSAILLLLININIYTKAQNKEIPYTQEDKERLIRLEVKVEEGFKRIDERFNEMDKRFNDKLDVKFASLQKQIDGISTFLYWGFGIMFGWIGILMGIVLRDRRTKEISLEKENNILEERIEKLEKAINKVA